MTTEDRPRFDVDALRDLAGETAFTRGEAYHRDGRVVILRIEPGRVVAQVGGTEDYRTELVGRGEQIGGECTCRAFEDRGFCKHMVAVGLAANAAGAAGDGEGQGEGAGALGRIRAHLQARGVGALVEMILGLAERDTALFRKLDMAASLAHADDKTLEARLRKAIDDATRTRDYVDYRQAAGWAADVDEVLDAVADLVPAGRAGLALKLAQRAIDRIERAVESIDDSDGNCGALMHHAGEIHLAAARAAPPEPVQFARDLFAREMASNFETFSGAAALYADVIGEKGLVEYRRLAIEAWEKLPSRSGAMRAAHDEFSGDYYRLEGILDFFAERDGDVDARIALRAKDLSSPWKYLELAQFCLAQGRAADALRRAEEGLWVFEDDRPDERLVLFAADLLSKAGRDGDAQAHLQRAFEKAPSLELYIRLRKLGGEAARERAIKFLEAGPAKQMRTRWHSAADILVRVLMHETMFDAAWAAVRKHQASMDMKETLAGASEATHPREALEVYAERVHQLAEAGGNPAYAEATALIAPHGRLAGRGRAGGLCRSAQGPLRPQAQFHEAPGVSPCAAP